MVRTIERDGGRCNNESVEDESGGHLKVGGKSGGINKCKKMTWVERQEAHDRRSCTLKTRYAENII